MRPAFCLRIWRRPTRSPFDPQAGAAAPTQISGCLLSKNDKFIIVDQTTNVTMEAYGAGLDKQTGNRVEITGTAEAAAPAVAGRWRRSGSTVTRCQAYR